MKNLLGQWTGKDVDSRWLICVALLKSGISVSVSDKIDGEQYVAENVGWSPRCVWFDLFVPSTGCRTFNRLHVVEGSQPYCEISYEEDWKCKDRLYLAAELNRLGKRAWVIGEWIDFEEESSTLIKITKRGTGVRVVATDLIRKRPLFVTNQRWKGSALTFATRANEKDWPIKSQLIAVSPQKLVHRITMVEIMKILNPRANHSGARARCQPRGLF